jgi:hypothetical protein
MERMTYLHSTGIFNLDFKAAGQASIVNKCIFQINVMSLILSMTISTKIAPTIILKQLNANCMSSVLASAQTVFIHILSNLHVTFHKIDLPAWPIVRWGIFCNVHLQHQSPGIFL